MRTFTALVWRGFEKHESNQQKERSEHQKSICYSGQGLHEGKRGREIATTALINTSISLRKDVLSRCSYFFSSQLRFFMAPSFHSTTAAGTSSGRFQWDLTFAGMLFIQQWRRMSASLFTAATWRRLCPLAHIFVQRSTSRSTSSRKNMQNKWPMSFAVSAMPYLPTGEAWWCHISHYLCKRHSLVPAISPAYLSPAALTAVAAMKESLPRRCLWAHSTNIENNKQNNKKKNKHRVNTPGS